MDPLGQLPRGALCQACRRERFAVYAGVSEEAPLAERRQTLHVADPEAVCGISSEIRKAEELHPSAVSQETAIQLFKLFDRHCKGSLDKDDFINQLVELRPVFWTNERLDLLMQEADTNCDGVVDCSEFVTWISKVDAVSNAFRRSAATLLHSRGSGRVKAAEGGATVEVNASTLAGQTCTVVVSMTSSIVEMKRLIQDSLGIMWNEQQLVCGMEVLDHNEALPKDVAAFTRATSLPDILVIKVPPCTRFTCIMIQDAGCAEVNGTYRRINTNCYAKEGNRSIRIFRYQADASWPAAWYIERNCRQSLYYAVPDQTAGEAEECNDGGKKAAELGYPLPLSGWAPWTGLCSEPGQLPAPSVMPWE